MEKLPEEVLRHILSFLPTKTSVSCSVLSKRWRSLELSSSIPVLDFDIDRDVPPSRFRHYSQDREQELSFAHTFQKALLLHRNSLSASPIKTIRLALSRTTSSKGQYYLNRCSTSAARGALEELHLRCIACTFLKGVSFNNMLVLKLTQMSHLGFVEPGCFPKLKVLHLSKVRFDETKGGSLENLLSACPVLQELRKRGGYDKHLRICVPTLTSLVLEAETDPGLGFVSYCDDVLLETPLLEYLRFNHHGPDESLVSTNLCNLRRVYVHSFVDKDMRAEESCDYGSRVMKLLSMLSRVEFLKLSYDTIRPIAYSELASHELGLVHGLDYSYIDKLPVFHNLVRLELCIPSCDCVMLPHLLQKFHSLKYISIDKKLGVEVAEASWKEPLQVPICLSSTLLTFHFQGFEGYEAEVELVTYVMKHAMVLKKFRVNTSCYFKAYKKRVDAVQKLPTVLRGSEAYQPEFD